MAETYKCPKCQGAIFVFDPELKRYVCPIDKTPLINFIPVDELLVID